MGRTYQAFISYRHSEVDSRVAAEVQRALERFHIPSAIRTQTGTKSLAPIFRDKEELPVTSELSHDISDALENSAYLVVICSPRLKESLWCQREVEAFLKTHDQSRVLTVLAEGEPEDVIPEVLLTRSQEVELEDGSTQQVMVPIEPLSCDFRSPRKSEHRPEVTRLAAAMLGVPFDSLAHRQQRHRRRIAAAAAIVVACVIAYGAWSLVQIRAGLLSTQKSQSISLAREAKELYEEGSGLEAIEVALAALPGEGGDRPVVAEAELTLQQVTHAYTPLSATTPYVRAYSPNYGAERSFAMPKEISRIDATSDGSVVAAYSYHGGYLRAWDVGTGTELCDITDRAGVIDFDLLDDGSLLVLLSNEVYRLSLADGETLWARDLQLREYDEGGSLDIDALTESFYLGRLDDDLGLVVLVSDQRCLSVDPGTGEIVSEISLAGLEGESAYITLDTPREEGSGSFAIEWKDEASAQDDMKRVALVSVEAGSSTLSEERFKRVSALKALSGGRMLVSAKAADSKDDESSRSSETSKSYLTAYDQQVACLDVVTGKTLWTQKLQLWQACRTVTMFEMTLDLGDEQRDVVVWCGANLCAWLDVQTGELLGSVETVSSFVSAWPGSKREKNDLEYWHVPEENEVIEGCLVNGEVVACTPKEGASRSGKVYPSDAQQVISVPTGELVACESHVILFADGLGDASWRQIADSSIYDLFPIQRGVVAVDSYGSADENEGPTVRLFDPVSAKEVWCTRLTEDAASHSIDFVGITQDESKLVFFDGYAEKPHLVIVSSQDGSLTTEPSSSENTGETEQSHVVGYNAVVCGNRVVSQVSSLDLDTIAIAATDLDTMESKVYTSDVSAGMYTVWKIVPLSSKKLLVAVNTDDSSETGAWCYVCSTLELDSGTFTLLDESVMYGSGNAAAILADDGALYTSNGQTVCGYSKTGDKLFSSDIAGLELLTMRISSGTLDLLLLDGEQAVVRCLDLRSGSVKCQSDLDRDQFDPSSWYNGYGSVDWCDCGSPDEGLSALLTSSACIIMDREYKVHQIIGSCRGYDQVSDSFFVTPGYDESLGIYRRYTVEELVARGEELLGDSRMSEKRRRELGL